MARKLKAGEVGDRLAYPAFTTIANGYDHAGLRQRNGMNTPTAYNGINCSIVINAAEPSASVRISPTEST